MRVVIVGAGVVGMTSAWRLAQDGHEVTVLERHDGPGEETSFANGGSSATATWRRSPDRA